ncbi:hypothetical protein GGR52DRAFT_522240 [Hypoxylon sp. FL1284]|nr:hypothetical protein GGR52DRAFT_522240 [Hypoxylon sp. FL1284]
MLEQCWFLGYHSDIGGGTRGEGLAQFSLAWMIARLNSFVDMNLDNFWKPRLELSNWHLDKKDRLRIDLKDTFTLVYWLGGTEWRKPGRQFWKREGFKEMALGNDTLLDSEFMHFSVRFLTRQQVTLKSCKCLQDAEAPEPGRDVTWHLPIPHSCFQRTLHWVKDKIKAENTNLAEGYLVKEGPVRRDGASLDEMVVEMRLIRLWADSELKRLQHGKGSPEPFPVAKFKAALDNFLRTIAFQEIWRGRDGLDTYLGTLQGA